MEGRTIIYKATKGEDEYQTAYFSGKIAGYRTMQLKNSRAHGLTFVFDNLGRTVQSFWFMKDKKWAFVRKYENQMIEQSGYRMYAANWMDTEIMGYPCKAFFVREKAIFAPTYVFWVCDDASLPKKHPHNLSYPSLPGFVMAYSWNSKRRFEAASMKDTVDPYLFTDLDAVEESKEAEQIRRKIIKIIEPIAGNSILKGIENLYRLFAG